MNARPSLDAWPDLLEQLERDTERLLARIDERLARLPRSTVDGAFARLATRRTTRTLR